MYKFKRYSKRTLAAILSLMIVISAVSTLFTGLSASALSESDVTVLDNATGLDASNSVADGSNVKIGFQKKPSTGVNSIYSNTLGNLTDNNFSNETQIYWTAAPFFDVKEGHSAAEKSYDAIGTKYIDGTERFFQAVLPLKGKTDLSNILLVNHSEPDLQTYYYEVFASTDEATLFDADSSVYKYTNTAQKQIQNFKIAEGKLTNITFVGLRIYNPCYIDGTGEWNKARAESLNAEIYYPRLFEFNAYGTVTAPIEEAFSVTSNDTQAIPSDIGNQAFNDVQADFYASKDATPVNFNMSQLAKLVDGDVSSTSECQFMSITNNAVFTENGSEYMNFDFRIKDNFIIRKLLVINHANVNLATKRYDILVADTKEGLDTAVPLQAYDNANGDATQVFTVKAEEGIKAKFVRVKVLLPFDWAKYNTGSYDSGDTKASVCRFMEMGVYGEYDESAKFQYDIAQKDGSKADLTYPDGTNLVAGMEPTVEYVNPITGANYSNFNAEPATKISDADVNTMYHTSGSATHAYMDGETLKFYNKNDGVYSQITYNLGTIDTISDIVINNHDTPAIRMGSYDIYVSDTLAGLNKAENLVGTIITNGNRQQTIHFTKEVKGQYVRLRTYDVCNDKSWSSATATSVYLRLADFVVYGVKGTTSANEKVTLKAENNEAANPVTGKDTVVKDAKFTDKSYMYSSETSTTPRVNGSNAPSALKALTDGKVDNEVEIDTRFAEGADTTVTKIHNDGVTAYTNIIYTLDGKADISDIVVMGHHEADTWAISYDLYIGDKASTIFDSEPVYSYKNNGSRTQHYEVKDTKAAYVAMRITAACTSTDIAKYQSFANNFGLSIIHPRIYEFNVYGTAGAALDEVQFSESNSAAIPEEESIVASTATSYFDGTGEQLVPLSTISALTDGNANSEFMGSDTMTPFAVKDSNPIELLDDRYLKITHTLRNNAEISSIYVFNHSTTDLRTYKYKLYASKELSTLWDEGNLVYDFVNTDRTRGQLYTLVKEAKYVGMLITDPCNQPFASERTANQIYPRLYEFGVYGTADAETPGGSNDEEVRDIGDATMPTGNNIMKGRMLTSAVAYNTVTGDSTPVGTSSAQNFTDENMDTDWHTGTIHGNKYFAQWDTENNKPVLVVDGTVYVDAVYNLGGTATIDRIFIGHHNTRERRAKKYAIYVSDNDDEALFDESNLVKTVENNAPARGQEITFKTPLTGVRNIGIRIINPVWDENFALAEITATNYDDSCFVYPRLNEFAAYGTFEADPFVFDRVINNVSAALPSGIDLAGLNNLSTPLSAKMQFTNTVTNAQNKVSPSNPANMKDGDFSSESEVYAARFADWMGDSAAYYIEGQRYLDIYYDLGSKADVKYIVIGNHSTRELVTGKYDVYISNSKDDLYDDANLYTSVDNIKTYNKGSTNQVNVIAFDEAETGVDSKIRYVGIRMYTPVCAVGVSSTVTVTAETNNIYPRIREFSVYGTYLDPTFVPGTANYQDISKMDVEKDIFSKGENLLRKDNVTYMQDGKRTEASGSSAGVVNDFWKLQNGEKHYDFSFLTGDKPTMLFKLDKFDMTQINGFAYQGISQDNESYYASHIKVHVAEEREDVLLDSSVVFEYNLEDHGVNKSIYHEFPKGKEPQGCYLAFEFVNPVFTADLHVYPRMSLLYAWGEQAIVRGEPGNIAENMPIDIYFNNDGELSEVTEKNLTPAETKNLTDGNEETTALIDTKGSDRDTLEIMYNLCGDINIDKLRISTLIDSKHGFETMKVYAASTVAKINEDESLVWVYNVGSKKGDITPEKAFAPAKEMRYLKFVFEGTKDYLEIAEIEAIGLDNQKMKTRTITNNLAAEDITVLRLDLETGKQTYPTISNSYAEQLIDGDAETDFVFYDGVPGKTGYEIQIYLGDLRTVSSIINNFYKHFMEYAPGTINVYVAETFADVVNPDMEPTYTIKSKDVKDGVYEKQFRPMLARYIRFQFLDFKEFEEFVNPDGTPRLAGLIGDIKIIGTKVKGLNPNEDDDKLITFADEETGITASILKLNNEVNDIFTDAVSIKVTPEKATNWQMRSMQPSQFRVIDKKIYKIEFLDLYGNVVKDLGERDIAIGFKTPAGYSGSEVMVGDATLRTKISGLDTVSANGMSTADFKWDPTADNKVALLGMVAQDDPYWETIGELENFEEGNEDDLKGETDAEIHDATWYESIHTEDEAFAVTPVGFSFENGYKFVAENIADTAPEERYIEVLRQAGGKKVAAYYDMKLYQNDKIVDLQLDPNSQGIEIKMEIPAAISEKFTDLEMFHVDDNGIAAKLWSMVDGNYFIFQTPSFSDFVIVGTALDGSTSFGDGNQGGTVVPDQGGTVAPDQGGDVIVPDQGGDVIVPDQGGDVIVPDQGGDVIVPDQGGDVFVPDDTGDVVVPDDNWDGTYVPEIDDGIIDTPVADDEWVDMGDTEIGDQLLPEGDGFAPETGESARNLYVALLFLVAAGYVAIRFGKKAKE